MKTMQTTSLYSRAMTYIKLNKGFNDLIDDCWNRYDFKHCPSFVANRLASIFNVGPDEIKCYIVFKDMI